MTNILLEGYNIDAPWLSGALKPYIRPDMKVAVVAFAFRDSQAKGIDDWNRLYGKEQGIFYDMITRALGAYGIPGENIAFLNYFADTKETAAEKVRKADILFFTGGLPDRMVDRIDEFDLADVLMAHRGVVMGWSAGALLQLKEYHLSPDKDYPEFGYYRGLPWLEDFYLEVHYEGTEVQKAAIRRVLQERKKPVYATYAGRGAIIVEDGKLQTVGQVERFE